MSKYGLLGKAKKEKKAWDRWVAGLMSRYTRILTDEGFTLDSATAPEGVVKLAGFTWAKYKAKKQLLEIVGKFDDRAIRERFHRNL
jgi:hypothetical protein